MSKKEVKCDWCDDTGINSHSCDCDYCEESKQRICAKCQPKEAELPKCSRHGSVCPKNSHMLETEKPEPKLEVGE